MKIFAKLLPLTTLLVNAAVVRNLTPASFSEQLAWCSGLGGKLPWPKTADDNDFLVGLGSTWLAFSTDDALAFYWTNWAEEQPSGFSTTVQLLVDKQYEGSHGWSGSDGWLYEQGNGKWYTGWSTHGLPATCFTEFDFRPGAAILRSFGWRNAEDAAAYCVEQVGGALPVPENDRENQATALVGSTYLGFQTNRMRHLTYKNWQGAEPNWYGSDTMPPAKQYVHMQGMPKGYMQRLLEEKEAEETRRNQRGDKQEVHIEHWLSDKRRIGNAGTWMDTAGDKTMRHSCYKLITIWSRWSDWTECSDTCSRTGQQMRFRNCHNGSPGDLGCRGDSTQFVTCQLNVNDHRSTFNYKPFVENHRFRSRRDIRDTMRKFNSAPKHSTFHKDPLHPIHQQYWRSLCEYPDDKDPYGERSEMEKVRPDLRDYGYGTTKFNHPGYEEAMQVVRNILAKPRDEQKRHNHKSENITERVEQFNERDPLSGEFVNNLHDLRQGIDDEHYEEHGEHMHGLKDFDGFGNKPHGPHVPPASPGDSPGMPNTGKILCLHGGGQTAAGLRAMDGMRDLMAALPNFEFVFASSPEIGNVWIRDPPGGKDEPTFDFNWADSSFDTLDGIVANQGPFYGLLGYSQGSAIIPVYLAARPQNSFDRVMLFNGYVTTTHAGLLATLSSAAPLDTPALIFSGGEDPFRPGAFDQATFFDNVIHLDSPDVGHELPIRSDPNFQTVVDFVNNVRPAHLEGPPPSPAENDEMEKDDEDHEGEKDHDGHNMYHGEQEKHYGDKEKHDEDDKHMKPRYDVPTDMAGHHMQPVRLPYKYRDPNAKYDSYADFVKQLYANSEAEKEYDLKWKFLDRGERYLPDNVPAWSEWGRLSPTQGRKYHGNHQQQGWRNRLTNRPDHGY